MIRAVDVGFGRVKGLGSSSQVSFPSVVGDFRPIRFTSGLEQKDWVDRLCVEYRDRQYFVGSMAFKQAKARVTMNAQRFTSEEGMALLMAALALLADETVETVKLATGLPVSEYARLKEDYREALEDRHEIKVLTPDGNELETFDFAIDDVKILPQPVGTIFDAVLDKSGGLAEKELAAGKVAVLDIGRNTVDMALTDSLSFVDRQSVSYDDIGLDDAYRDLSAELKSTLGVNIPPESIEPYLQSGVIKKKSIGQEKERVFGDQAEKIASRVFNTWKEIWDIDKIIITGGGAVILGDYIARALGSPEQLEIYQDELATFSNVAGFAKFAKRAWG